MGAIYPSHVIPSTAPNFIGHIQQLVFNGIPYLEHILSGLYHDHVLSGTFGRQRGILYHTITFTSHYTYLGLPQMKAYNEVNIYFQFRTLEPDGLIMYNAGKGKDFLAIEMVAGHLHYVFNLGHDTVVLRDTSAKALNDNLWHSVSIGRPSKTKHTLLIDDNQLATVTADGRDIHLDLDGILFLGKTIVHQGQDGLQTILESLPLNSPDTLRQASGIGHINWSYSDDVGSSPKTEGKEKIFGLFLCQSHHQLAHQRPPLLFSALFIANVRVL